MWSRGNIYGWVGRRTKLMRIRTFYGLTNFVNDYRSNFVRLICRKCQAVTTKNLALISSEMRFNRLMSLIRIFVRILFYFVYYSVVFMFDQAGIEIILGGRIFFRLVQNFALNELKKSILNNKLHFLLLDHLPLLLDKMSDFGKGL